MFGGVQGKRAAVAAVGVASALFTVSIASPALGGPDAFSSAAGAVSTAKKALKIAKRAEKAAKRNGGRGPQGPIGPAGPAGPAGPPGASTAITRGTIDTPVITGGTVVQSLSLPAGNWVVMAHVDGAHNGTAASTRMECQLVDAGDQLMDYAKMRAQRNDGAAVPDPMVFVSLGLHGTATLSAPGTVRTICGSTNGTSFTLTTAKMTAVQVGSIVVQ
jgi:hypothetical protein